MTERPVLNRQDFSSKPIAREVHSLPWVEAIVVLLYRNSSIAKVKKHCKRRFHFSARSNGSNRYSENPCPTSLDRHSAFLSHLRYDLVLLSLKDL